MNRENDRFRRKCSLFQWVQIFWFHVLFQRYTHHIYRAWGGILHRHHRQLANPWHFTRSHWSSWQRFLASPPQWTSWTNPFMMQSSILSGSNKFGKFSASETSSMEKTTHLPIIRAWSGEPAWHDGQTWMWISPVSPRCCVVPWWMHFLIFFLLAQDISTDSGSYILYPSLFLWQLW